MNDPRIDAYIEKSAPFAQPILRHVRAAVHKACPAVQETIKWGFPHFEYHGILCSMAAFKAHCAVSFWKGDLLAIANKSDAAMGQFGRLTSIAELPNAREFAQLIRAAMKLNEAGAVAPARPKLSGAECELVAPAVLLAALKKNKAAAATFAGFSYSNKKEYAQWIVEAKTGVTRDKRLQQAVEWLAEGKIKNWKYVR